MPAILLRAPPSFWMMRHLCSLLDELQIDTFLESGQVRNIRTYIFLSFRFDNLFWNTERFLGFNTIYMIDTKPQLCLAYCQFPKNNFEAVLFTVSMEWIMYWIWHDNFSKSKVNWKIGASSRHDDWQFFFCPIRKRSNLCCARSALVYIALDFPRISSSDGIWELPTSWAGVENDRFKIHENCRVNPRLNRDALGHKESYNSFRKVFESSRLCPSPDAPCQLTHLLLCFMERHIHASLLCSL